MRLPFHVSRAAILISLCLLMATICGCNCTEERSGYWHVREGQIYPPASLGTEPYYFIGTNFWYGVILASDGEGGDRGRLHRELDSLHAMGVDNLRILVGADGPDGTHSKVEPTLQKAPGEYDETLLRALDYLMVELGRRDMSAVLYLNNAWEWSGGFGQYLMWAGAPPCPIPLIDGGDAYMEYMVRFQRNKEAKALFSQYVTDIVSRTNTITGRPYSEDTAIFSWQICNEPRPFSLGDNSNRLLFAEWIRETAQLIRSLDPNHMISTGSEGKYGCESDMALVELIHSYPEIDYINIHIWPTNWGWSSRINPNEEDLERSISKSYEYIEEHLPIAERLGKPIIIEEFGYPRDGFSFSKESTTEHRDLYYSFVFELVKQSRLLGGVIAGCNFWGWAGIAEPSTEHDYWQKGDPYTADPAQEPQGLFSVFHGDSTVEIIRKYSTI